MEKAFQGDVTFVLDDKPRPHRFEVSVTAENKIILWIEDRQSKKQWTTDVLEDKDFVTHENAIPKVTIYDYAERYAACLSSTGDDAEFKSVLTVKGGHRVLLLTLPFQWATRDLALDYKFALNAVPLAQIDILGARLRDVEEKGLSSDTWRRELEAENEQLKAEATQLSLRVDELSAKVNRAPVFVQASTTTQHSVNQTLVWSAGASLARGVIDIHPTGQIQFREAGVYAIDVALLHTSASNSVVFELQRAGVSLMSCYGNSYDGYYDTTPLRYVLIAEANDEISVVYKASGYAQPGSRIAILML